MLEELPGEEIIIPSITVHSMDANYKPIISKFGNVGNTPFQANLKLKINVPIILTYNVNLLALLIS